MNSRLKRHREKGWSEFGTVTGRQRRAADFDFDLARRAIMLNSATQIAITKLDVLFPDCAGKSSFDELSDECKIIHSKYREPTEPACDYNWNWTCSQ